MHIKKDWKNKKFTLTLVMAMTADGKIARNSNEFVDWTSRADKRLFYDVSSCTGTVIMGKNTFNSFDGILENRLNIVMTSETSEINHENLIFYSGSPGSLIDMLVDMGISSAVLAGGAMINYSFYKYGLIDRLVLTISPYLFGTGLSLFSGEINEKLIFHNVEKIDEETIMIEYLFNKGNV